MRILITGASGFIGAHLVREFTPNHDVWHGSAEEMDLRDPVAIDRVVEAMQPEVVIHLAARTEVEWSFEEYLPVSHINYIGTVALAEANRRINPHLRLFVMASTNETYGHQPDRYPFDEDTPQHPAAPYAVAKVACERYLEFMGYAYGFPFTILRQANTYGRPDNDYFVVERIVTQMVRGRECRLGTPVPWRNFLYIDDLVRLYRRVLEAMPIGETFVTGPDNALSIAELAERVQNLLGWRGHIEWDTLPPRPGEVYYLNTDAHKARDLLGWEPAIQLDEGLKLTIDKWS